MCSAPVLHVVIVGSSLRTRGPANLPLVPGRSPTDILNPPRAAQATAGRRVSSGPPMKPAAFDYVVAESVDAALAALAAAGGAAQILAGGPGLRPSRRLRRRRRCGLV